MELLEADDDICHCHDDAAKVYDKSPAERAELLEADDDICHCHDDTWRRYGKLEYGEEGGVAGDL